MCKPRPERGAATTTVSSTNLAHAARLVGVRPTAICAVRRAARAPEGASARSRAAWSALLARRGGVGAPLNRGCPRRPGKYPRELTSPAKHRKDRSGRHEGGRATRMTSLDLTERAASSINRELSVEPSREPIPPRVEGGRAAAPRRRPALRRAHSQPRQRTLKPPAPARWSTSCVRASSRLIAESPARTACCLVEQPWTP